MRKIKSICTLLAALVIMASCASSDTDVTLYGEAAITAFTLGKLKKYETKEDSEGNITTNVTTFTGSSYKFVIDQVERKIYNTDSLPVGTDAAHVLCTISTARNGVAMFKDLEEEDAWMIYSSIDSIDFTNPRTVRVVSSDGNGHTDYDVRVNVHKQKGDTIEWELMDVDFPSDPVLPQGIKQLLGGFTIEEYALSDKNKLMVSYDLGLTWTQDIPDTHEDIDEVPTKDVALVAYPMNMADRTMYVLMAGNRNGSSSVWRKIVDLDWGAPETGWSYMDRAGEEEFDLPVLKNLSLVYYDKSILAFGGDYKTIYQSRDNGITWKTNKAFVMPKDFDYQVESVKAAVDDEDYIWLYCKLINGDKQVWRGRLNRLGWFYQ